MSQPDPFESQIAIYALGALEGEARIALEEHLGDCVPCRDALRLARTAVDLLPLASDPLEPAPQTRSRLLRRIQADCAVAPPDDDVVRGSTRIGRLPGWLLALCSLLLVGLATVGAWEGWPAALALGLAGLAGLLAWGI